MHQKTYLSTKNMEKLHLFEPYGSDEGSDVDGHHDLQREDDSLLPISRDSQPSIMFNSSGETQQYSSRRKTHRHKVISGKYLCLFLFCQ